MQTHPYDQEDLVASLSSKRGLVLVVQDVHVALLQVASGRSTCKTAGELCDAILEVVVAVGLCVHQVHESSLMGSQ